MRLFFATCLTFAAVAASAACSGESNPNPVDTDGGSGAGGNTNLNFENGGPGTCEGTVRPTNDAFCKASACSAVTPNCATAAQRPVDGCCVNVVAPGRNPTQPTLVRTTDTNKFSDPLGKPVDLSCFEPAGYPPKPSGTPETVTLQGIVEPFSNGCDIKDVKVEVYRVKRTGDATTDGELGELVGTAIVTGNQADAELVEVKKCDGFGGRTVYRYSYPGVPTDTELLVKTSGATASAQWANLYSYNLYIAAGDPDYDATAKTYTRTVQALAVEDFNTIPQVAIGRGIDPGRGAIGGEIHDCGNIRVQNAAVDVSVKRESIAYFNDDEDSPLPDISRVGYTGRTALYSALNVPAGPARVSAVGLVADGSASKLVTLGYYDVQVFADSVTSVTLRGARPFQTP
jgi:hypothetical protein